MRINRDILHKIASDTVRERTRANRNILCSYLTGSLLDEEPLLGGATDIDLVMVHNGEPEREREIIPLTEQVHLDIHHHGRRLYNQPRQLRRHPWLGPAVFQAQVLFDPQHFMDFTQASVRGQFDRPEYTLGRAEKQAEAARQIWFEFYSNQPIPDPDARTISKYISALELVANAVASLVGGPLTRRRFLLNYKEKSEQVGDPGLYVGLIGLLGATELAPQVLKNWLPT